MIWSQDKIIRELKRIAKMLGHSPSTRDVDQTLYQASRRFFDSFNKAKEVAKLKINPIKYHQINKNAKKWSIDLSYILGVIEGDGYYRKRKRSSEIILKVEDKDFAQEFRKRIQRWSGIQPKCWTKDKNFYVALYSVSAVNIIQQLDLNKINARNKKIKSNFLRGMYDSEGGVAGLHLNQRKIACRWIHFSNSDKKIIKLVNSLLKNFKIQFKTRSRIHSGFDSKKLQYEILIFGLENFEKFYKNIKFSIERKNKKLLQVINSYEKYQKNPCL